MTPRHQTPDVLSDRAHVDFVATVTDPDFFAWLERVRHIGGCENPVHLVGHTYTFDAHSGDLLHVFTSDTQPHGRLTIACGNRRASRCGPCSWLHQGDTYQLVVSGLAGGKGVPDTVRDHPRVFLTLTAPSFGPVHRAADTGKSGVICRPDRRGTCAHGLPRGCDATHEPADRLVGVPLCPACYDYPAAVLFNAHAGELWDRLMRNVRRRLAAAAGVPASRLPGLLRVSFAKVAEYQRRGSVHFHAVIRLDGPDGPADGPPVWATLDTLTDALRTARAVTWVDTPDSAALGAMRLRFGSQLDIHPVRAFGDGDELTERAVASYIAKYVTKGDVPGVLTDTPVRHPSTIGLLPVTDHAQTLMHTCWRLGGLPEFELLKMRTWTHQLGYRGHITTKSRAYSTTYTRLRATRVTYRRNESETPHDDDVFTESRWSYAGQGYTDVQTLFVADIADGLAERHEARADIRAAEGRQRHHSPDASRGVPRSGSGGREGHAIDGVGGGL